MELKTDSRVNKVSKFFVTDSRESKYGGLYLHGRVERLFEKKCIKKCDRGA